MKKWFILFIILLLASFSLISLQSIAPDLLLRQTLFYVLGVSLFFIISRTQFQEWKTLTLIAYVILNLLLLGLLIFGRSTRGTTGWIELFGGYKLQPSQFAVTWSTLFIAFQLENTNTKTLVGFFKLLALIALPGFLILAEPDIGTALVYFLSLAVVFLIYQFSAKHILGLLLAVILGGALLWQFGLNLQRRQRITSFISGYEQQDDAASYNARQALIAVGSGQFYGRGLGFGVQSHLKFLPERQTDFIFASIAEEWGFIGSSLVILAYVALCLYLLLIANKLENTTYRIFVLVHLTMFLVQIGINIGMNLGLVPITGITLPLLSYGGSSLLSVLISLGLIQSLLKEISTVKPILIN
ncbi:MAG: FtsW/RodA/SpoVE family cell cycle protein [Patescibacteria group bacterium]|nr:FtsW/RodA/SpoVE family cell cycle protein [Patescibacteria group bacterium]